MFRTDATAMRRKHSGVAAAECGDRTTLSSPSKGWSGGGGSSRVMSSPAPRRRPDVSAATRAGSSTSAPRHCHPCSRSIVSPMSPVAQEEITGFEAGDVAFSASGGGLVIERNPTATVRLIQDIFAKVGESRPVVLVAPVARAGAVRDLHGVPRARRENGN